MERGWLSDLYKALYKFGCFKEKVFEILDLAMLQNNWHAMTRSSMILGPFDYNMVGFFLHTFFIDFLSCINTSYLQ